jgi:hypothetical protein
MSGFCINFKDFNKNSLSSGKGPQPARVPDGVGRSTEIPINYMYINDEGKESESRLIIEGPLLTTKKGIEPPKQFSSGTGKGKPAIPVIFDLSDPDQAHFVGGFGNKHEYRKVKGGIERVHEDFVSPFGVLGSIYEWCIDQYARYLVLEDGGKKDDEPGMLEYRDASIKINTKDFFYQRVHKDGDLKGKIVEDSNPLKFFKLLTYAPGTPEENLAKFYLPDGTKLDNTTLFGKSFSFRPFISFRRIFISEKVSVTVELTEAVVTDFHESMQGISIRSSRLIQRMKESDPEQAALVAEKYRLLMGDNTSHTELSVGVKVDTIDSKVIDGDDSSDSDDAPIEETKDITTSGKPPSRRPGLPSSMH